MVQERRRILFSSAAAVLLSSLVVNGFNPIIICTSSGLVLSKLVLPSPSSLWLFPHHHHQDHQNHHHKRYNYGQNHHKQHRFISSLCPTTATSILASPQEPTPTPTPKSSENNNNNGIVVDTEDDELLSGNSQLIRLLPLSIHVLDLSVDYIQPALQRLFSSVPQRAYALQNVTLHLTEPQLVLLTGDSSAGKSTLLRAVGTASAASAKATANAKNIKNKSNQYQSAAVAETRWRTQGRVELTTGMATSTTTSSPPGDSSSGMMMTCSPHSIYLDASKDTPKYAYDRRDMTVVTLVQQKLVKKTTQSSVLLPMELLQHLAQRLIRIFMNDEECKRSVSSWSQSQFYRMRLLEACLDSSLFPVSAYEPSVSVLLPAPLLLLDEWLDRETSTVIQSVQASLEELVRQTGAMVLVVTHYPERWNLPSSMSSTTTTTTTGTTATLTKQVILSMGKILLMDST